MGNRCHFDLISQIQTPSITQNHSHSIHDRLAAEVCVRVLAYQWYYHERDASTGFMPPGLPEDADTTSARTLL